MPRPGSVSVGDAIHFGWKTIQTHLGFLVGTTVAAWVIPVLIEWGSHLAFHRQAQHFAMWVISTIVTATLYLGLFKIYLRLRDGETPVFENLFDGAARFWVWVGSTFIAIIAVVMGLVLLIVPGIIILTRLMFVGFVIVDEPVGPIDALQRSWDITRGHTVGLIGFFIVLCGLNLLGIICLGVGVLITAPMTGLALAHVYRVLKPRAAADGRAPAAAMA